MPPNDHPSNAAPSGARDRFERFARSSSVSYVVLGLAILGLDLATGRVLQFPILFVIPVALAGWFRGPRAAFLLATLLPLGRFIIAVYIETPYSFAYIVANALIRIAVLTLIAYLVAHCARQNRELKDRINSLVTICAWSRTVQHEGDWISFEEYLLRRFKIHASHGVSPAEAERLREELKAIGGQRRD